jgi:hypothetical protein
MSHYHGRYIVIWKKMKVLHLLLIIVDYGFCNNKEKSWWNYVQDGKRSNSHAKTKHYITNLTSHKLVMEIMQNSFIHNLYVLHIDIMHWKQI